MTDESTVMADEGEEYSTSLAATAAQETAAESLFDEVNVLDADESFELLKEFFAAADEDGNGYLDRNELASVINLFYKQEKISRKMKVVQHEVDQAINRFDANGDGVLQFDEFVDMFALSDSFRFAMPISVRLEVRSKMQEEKGLRMREELMEEREHMLNDATRLEKIKTKQLNTLVSELTSRLDDKVLQTRMLEDDLNDCQEQLKATESRLKEALAEVDRLYQSSLEKTDGDTLRVRSSSNSNANSFSPRYSMSPRGASLRSPQSARSNASQAELAEILDTLDEMQEVPPPRTPSQGEIRRKRQGEIRPAA